MPLHVKSSDIPEAKRVQTGEAGTGSMVVTEQINYVVDGEIWFYCASALLWS